MAIVSSKEFNQRASAILKIAETEPVYITKWGKVVNVLSSYAHYQAHIKPQSLADAFSQPHSACNLTEKFEQEFEQTLTQIRQENRMNVPDFGE